MKVPVVWDEPAYFEDVNKSIGKT